MAGVTCVIVSQRLFAASEVSIMNEMKWASVAPASHDKSSSWLSDSRLPNIFMGNLFIFSTFLGAQKFALSSSVKSFALMLLCKIRLFKIGSHLEKNGFPCDIFQTSGIVEHYTSRNDCGCGASDAYVKHLRVFFAAQSGWRLRYDRILLIHVT